MVFLCVLKSSQLLDPSQGSLEISGKYYGQMAVELPLPYHQLYESRLLMDHRRFYSPKPVNQTFWSWLFLVRWLQWSHSHPTRYDQLVDMADTAKEWILWLKNPDTIISWESSAMSHKSLWVKASQSISLEKSVSKFFSVAPVIVSFYV